ncbi:MAG: methylmalonyl Co-A mutase-associated GTPase MeaB [Acidobacteria bacterium]|nr:methylmalonyl Co-A mutase-associated GTPase MeaB [Acidobacteriota bacterium]
MGAGVKRLPRRRLTADQYVDGILAGDRIVLARAITLVESDLPSDADLASEVIERCLPHTGRARRIGITGVPGAGKSTFIEALGIHLADERGERLAVLTIDPSSPVSGGSILGDKTRMEKLATHERAFVRPSASRGHLGGVARRTREAMLLCEAAGYPHVFVETVGVGQSETTVRSMVDFFLLLMLPGAGDELQGMKRGILEMTDLIAINKADGENRRRAARARHEYESALHLFPAAADGWNPRVVTCSALTREGVREIWDAVLEHRTLMESNGWFERHRSEQALEWMKEALLFGLEQEIRRDPAVRRRLDAVQQDVLHGRVSPFRAARELLTLFRQPPGS